MSSQTNVIPDLTQETPSRILLIVMDGLGGLPVNGKTELEAARTPNFDALAQKSSLGLLYPVGRGITPGSGPGHLSLFGYDPIKNLIGRGALSAAGIGLEQKNGDVCVRVNFCSIDANGKITDRRAGRIATDVCAKLCGMVNAEAQVPGVEIRLEPEMDYRAVLRLRGEGLNDGVSETDPQITGIPALASKATDGRPGSKKLAAALNEFVNQVNRILKHERPANSVLLRGISERPKLSSFEELYKLKSACIASYPMYRGLASLAGMEVIPTGMTVADEVKTLEKHFSDFTFTFFHVKKTDSYGEDGNYDAKVHVIEEVDALLPKILALKPDCIAFAADHSSPSLCKAHSWHPVPVMIHAPYSFADGSARYTEREASRGILGHIAGIELMPLLLAHAGKLKKYGA